jgi:integrase
MAWCEFLDEAEEPCLPVEFGCTRDDRVAHAVAEGVELLLLMGGLRSLAPRWRDVVVDWKDDTADRGHLSISRAVGVIKVKGQPERVVEDGTKTGVARSVALDADTVKLLRRWRLARTELSLASGRPDRLVSPDALVFGTVNGGYRHPERFSRLSTQKLAQCHRKLEDTCPADDLPPTIRLHDLRHSHGSQLYLDGHPLKVIAERLGHDEVVLLRT